MYSFLIEVSMDSGSGTRDWLGDSHIPTYVGRLGWQAKQVRLSMAVGMYKSSTPFQGASSLLIGGFSSALSSSTSPKTHLFEIPCSDTLSINIICYHEKQYRYRVVICKIYYPLLGTTQRARMYVVSSRCGSGGLAPPNPPIRRERSSKESPGETD